MDVSLIEVVLGGIFVFLSFVITYFLYKMKKASALTVGFIIITVWSLLEFLDEFFVKNLTREIVFNIGGRVVLIIGVSFLIFSLRHFIRRKENET